MAISPKGLNAKQAGIALTVALILLVLVTLIGIAAVSGTTMQQRMTANFYDREIAFQAAEAALRTGAASLSTSGIGIRNCGAGGIICVVNPFKATNLDPSHIHTVTSAQFAIGANAASQPQYVIENLGAWPNPDSNTGFDQSANAAQYGAQGLSQTSIYYRITARSGDPASIGERSVVTLQAIYRQ